MNVPSKQNNETNFNDVHFTSYPLYIKKHQWLKKTNILKQTQIITHFENLSFFASSSNGKGHTPDPPATEIQVNTVSAGCDAKVAAVAALKAAATRATNGWRPQSW